MSFGLKNISVLSVCVALMASSASAAGARGAVEAVKPKTEGSRRLNEPKAVLDGAKDSVGRHESDAKMNEVSEEIAAFRKANPNYVGPVETSSNRQAALLSYVKTLRDNPRLADSAAKFEQVIANDPRYAQDYVGTFFETTCQNMKPAAVENAMITLTDASVGKTRAERSRKLLVSLKERTGVPTEKEAFDRMCALALPVSEGGNCAVYGRQFSIACQKHNAKVAAHAN